MLRNKCRNTALHRTPRKPMSNKRHRCASLSCTNPKSTLSVGSAVRALQEPRLVSQAPRQESDSQHHRTLGKGPAPSDNLWNTRHCTLYPRTPRTPRTLKNSTQSHCEGHSCTKATTKTTREAKPSLDRCSHHPLATPSRRHPRQECGNPPRRGPDINPSASHGLHNICRCNMDRCRLRTLMSNMRRRCAGLSCTKETARSPEASSTWEDCSPALGVCTRPHHLSHTSVQRVPSFLDPSRIPRESGSQHHRHFDKSHFPQ
mmetsp:Transcript_183714/g.582775  ORF Transcript_183714/g.582775 Transcript_183714/m.582775 type:complete len:260 (+) Transcript_183714:240-1019(+)